MDYSIDHVTRHAREIPIAPKYSIGDIGDASASSSFLTDQKREHDFRFSGQPKSDRSSE